MNKKKKGSMEFRYYELMPGMPLLALLGEKWIHSVTEKGHRDTLHFHNYMEIGYCYHGEGAILMEDTEHKVSFQAQTFTILPKNFPHSTVNNGESESSWEYLFVDVDGFLNEKYGDNPRKAEELIRLISAGPGIFQAEEEPVMAGMIRNMIELMRSMEEYYLDEVKSLLWALLLEIARKNRRENDGQPGPEKYQAIISRALDFISDHYAQDIRVGELAGMCHISETHFRRVFHACMGISPAEYINLVRIRMACDFMKKGNESVSVIANRVGFEVLSTFNRNFRKIMGVSPSEWKGSPENWERKLLDFNVRKEEGW